MGIRLSAICDQLKSIGAVAGVLVITTVSAALIAMGCSGRTTAYITADLLTYFESEERVVEFALLPLATYDFYLLPGIQLDDAGTGPDSSRIRGMIIDLPSAPETPSLSGFVTTFEGAITVGNLNQTGVLQLVHLSVLAAPTTAANVYEEGALLVSLPVDPIGPGEASEASFVAHIDEDSPLSEIIATSSMRVGIKLTFPETTNQTMEAGFELTHLQLSVSGRPFLLIPD